MAYELRTLDVGGDPGREGSELLARTVAARAWFDDRPNWDHPDHGEVPVPAYASCVAASRQGLSPGWVVSWHDDIPGQQISLEGIPDGDYALHIIADPSNVIVETNGENNVLSLAIRLSGDGSQVEILG